MDSPGAAANNQTRTTVLMAVLTAVLLAGWSWPVFFPLRMLVVLFHECGHAFTALATGG